MDYWSVNDRAFAYWEADEYYYPATITEIEGDDIYIRYDTGEEEWTTADYLAEMKIEVGDAVEAKWSQDEAYYPAQVAETRGEEVRVIYDDSNEEWISLSNLRTWYEE